MKLREFTYGSRKFEVHAKKTSSGHTWSVQVLEGGKPANGAFYSASTEIVDDGKQHGIDILKELGATAEADFTTWSDRMNRP